MRAVLVRAVALRAAQFLAVAGGAAVLFGSAAGVLRPTSAQAGEDAAALRHAYSERVRQSYDFHLGKGEPFLPSNATTDTGEFLDPKSFPTAAYCGHCHRESHAEWRQSAHANSFRAPWYQKNVSLLMETKGVEYARHCEGCHNPIALASGSMTKGVAQKRGSDEDGITCAVCHSIEKVDRRGTGSYVLAQPAVMVDEAGKPVYGKVSDAEILAHLDRHSKAVMKDFYRTPDFCGSCHKAALPQALNDYKWQRAIFLSDEWQNSSFAKQSPLPFYTKPAESTCQTCHMARAAFSMPDPGAKDGKLASHRWLGANTMIPTFYHYDEQLQKTTAFLQAGVFNVDLFALQKGDAGALIGPWGTERFTVAPCEAVTVSVVIQNKGAAHSHVPEQRDIYESWVQFTVKDAAGAEVMHSGFLKADGELDERAHSFTNRLINKDGKLNAFHEVWTNRVVAYNNTIQSGRSQVVRYQFRVPPGMSSGALSVTAEVDYRRFNQHFIDSAMGRHTVEPVVVMASRTRVLNVGTNDPAPAPDAADNPTWMRWNNYGIGLLDAQQYGEAVHAFEQVASLRPEYADAYTNIAIASFQWEKYDLARVNLEKALGLDKGNARALYYLALVERNQGHLDLAIEDLKRVAAGFPESRDAHRELGFSFYQQHNYQEARREYERLQQIDPDDLAAHYNLSILYRRLGMKPEAAVEAARFADQKDDPTANTYALEYLRNHDEIATESVAWHVHGAAEASHAVVAGKGR
ncbi:MAG: tetratricopeptide repeat protein [Acidobacteriota bacterium]|nr:tetratricopeptide repeat protein [Acidobacteriota bacterium]